MYTRLLTIAINISLPVCCDESDDEAGRCGEVCSGRMEDAGCRQRRKVCCSTEESQGAVKEEQDEANRFISYNII